MKNLKLIKIHLIVLIVIKTGTIYSQVKPVTSEQIAVNYFVEMVLSLDTVFSKKCIKADPYTSKHYTSLLSVYSCQSIRKDIDYADVDAELNNKETIDTLRVRLLLPKGMNNNLKNNCKMTVFKALQYKDFFYVQIKISHELMGCDYFFRISNDKIIDWCKSYYVR